MEDKKTLIIIIGVIALLIFLYFFLNKTGVFNREDDIIEDTNSDADTSTNSEIETSTDINTSTSTASLENQIVVINPNGAAIYYQQFPFKDNPYIPVYKLVTTLPPFPQGKSLTFVGQKLTDTSTKGKYFYETTEPTNITGHPDMSSHLFVRAEDVKVV